MRTEIMDTPMRLGGRLSRFWISISRGAYLVAAFSAAIAVANAAPRLISDPETDAQTLNINSGIAMLSNGGHANLYLHQTGGDQVTWEPTAPTYEARVVLFDASNHVVSSFTANEPSSPGESVNAAAISALANGGFVVAWTTITAAGEYGAVYYETFDNDGTPAHQPDERHQEVSSRQGNQIAVAGLAGGGFAVVFASGDNAAAQRDFVSTFSYGGSLSSFTKVNEVQLGDPINTTTTENEGTAKLFISSSNARIAALSDGSFVVMEPTYVWVNPNYTPLGDHLYKFSSTGAPTNFANGFPHLRINWNNGLSAGDIVALREGGFATMNRGQGSNWELNIFNNDGTLAVVSPQTQQVYQNGGYVSKSYNALVVAPVVGSWSGSVAITELQENLLIAFNSSAGFDLATRSRTTGETVGLIEDAGVSPASSPTGRILTNVRLGSSTVVGWGMTFDDFYEDPATYYTTAATYEVGFVPANVPPTVSDVGNQTTFVGVPTDAIAFTIGDAETAAADLTVTALSSNTTLVPNEAVALGGSGANRTITITPAAGETGTTTLTLTVEDASGATATDVFVLTVSDNTPPTVVSVERLTPTAQTIGPATASVVFRVTYSEAVTNVSASDFAIEAVNGGTVSGSVTNVSGSGTTRDAAVSITSGSGEFRLTVIN